jgi:uncharacterized delta-60 repeat protein
MLRLGLVALLVLAAASARAAPQSTGAVTTTFGLKSDDVGQALLIQPNGRIVVAGYRSSGGDESDFAFARYRADGTLDPSFGAGGKVTLPFGFANAAALQPDGRIVAAGGVPVSRPDFDFALARFHADGTVDERFGAGGKVTTSFGPTADLVQAVAVQPDGKIVAAGSSGFPQLRNDVFALARYNADGTLDAGFGAVGKVTTSFGSPGDDTIHALALQPDGKIVAAGSNFVAAREGSSDFAVARYNADGRLDQTFGSGGKVTTTFGTASDFGNAVLLQPDGKIVVAGYSFQGRIGPSAFALARYNSDGTLDQGFGTGGRVTSDLGPASSAWAVALQPDGKIVAAGNGTGTFALARYNRDGSLDPSFGTGGKVSTPVPAGDDAAVQAVAVQPDGTVAAAGWTSTCTYQDFALVRYRSDGSEDAGFGSNLPRCVVPKVVRMTLAAARRAIIHRDCSLGPATRAFSRAVPKGRVIAQFPRAGTRCSPGRGVVLTVSKGRRPR